MYRIDGSSAGEIVTALADLGVSPKFISHSRSYVTAQLTGSVAVTLSLSDAVLRITEVIGPMAQGQGVARRRAHTGWQIFIPLTNPRSVTRHSMARAW